MNLLPEPRGPKLGNRDRTMGLPRLGAVAHDNPIAVPQASQDQKPSAPWTSPREPNSIEASASPWTSPPDRPGVVTVRSPSRLMNDE